MKTEVDKLDIDKLKILSTNLSNLKSKVNKLDIDELVPVPVDLTKLSNVLKNEVVKKTEYTHPAHGVPGTSSECPLKVVTSGTSRGPLGDS